METLLYLQIVIMTFQPAQPKKNGNRSYFPAIVFILPFW